MDGLFGIELFLGFDCNEACLGVLESVLQQVEENQQRSLEVVDADQVCLHFFDDIQASPFGLECNEVHSRVDQLLYFNSLKLKWEILILNVLIILQILRQKPETEAFVAHDS